MCSRGQGDGRRIWMSDVGFKKKKLCGVTWENITQLMRLQWKPFHETQTPALVSTTRSTWTPLAVPNSGEVRSVPLMQGIDWLMVARRIERSSTELLWIMVTLLLLHKPLPICPITQKQNDNNTIYEIYIHDYKLILFGQTSSSSSLALQFPNSIYGIGLGILSIKLGDKCGGWWSLLPLAPTSTCVTGGKKML